MIQKLKNKGKKWQFSAFIGISMTLIVGTALAFEYIGGYTPCALCLQQRIPYYAGIILSSFATFSAIYGLGYSINRAIMLIIGALMAYSLYLAVFHAGIEWQFWPGPKDCSVSGTISNLTTDNFLEQLNHKKPASCDQASGRFFGLSFAGWNACSSLVLLAMIMHNVWTSRQNSAV